MTPPSRLLLHLFFLALLAVHARAGRTPAPSPAPSPEPSPEPTPLPLVPSPPLPDQSATADCPPQRHTVLVARGGVLHFEPDTLEVHVGDTIEFVALAEQHNVYEVESADSCVLQPYTGIFLPSHTDGAVAFFARDERFEWTVAYTGDWHFVSSEFCGAGMRLFVSSTPAQTRRVVEVGESGFSPQQLDMCVFEEMQFVFVGDPRLAHSVVQVSNLDAALVPGDPRACQSVFESTVVPSAHPNYVSGLFHFAEVGEFTFRDGDAQQCVPGQIRVHEQGSPFCCASAAARAHGGAPSSSLLVALVASSLLATLVALATS